MNTLRFECVMCGRRWEVNICPPCVVFGPDKACKNHPWKEMEQSAPYVVDCDGCKYKIATIRVSPAMEVEITMHYKYE